MAATKNILFIMCDQLRWDYLSCYGHPKLHTPHIDALAARGVRFTHCIVQSPVCGPSRMSTYTGRYMQSHGASWNGFPLRVGEMTMGDYLRPLGMQAALVGKTHMTPDKETMQRLGIDPQSTIGVRTTECGFDPYERDDGLWAVGPDGPYDERVSRYNQYLNQKGYRGNNPWHDHANAGENPDGTLASGWAMRHARKPARIEEADSETPYMVGRAMDFITEAGDAPWCLHLSFIKPHWPYIAPAPYNDMYGKDDIIPVVRSDSERVDPQPVYREFMQHRVSQTFSRDEVREEIIPVYMGLIKQIDDQMGRLFAWLQQRGLMDNTMIVLTSDHGDYLGDHWLGEKDLFHDASVRVPLIIYDPSAAADAARGTTCPALVEAIDLLPTFIDAVGGKSEDFAHRLEGRSLMPLLHDQQPQTWREYTISEYDYSMTQAAQQLGVPFKETSLFMIADARWKLMHAPGFRPMLFDRHNDPQELKDLGTDPAYEAERQRLMAALQKWGLRISQRVTVSEKRVQAGRSRSMRRGILIGVWDESEIPEELWSAYRGEN